jgi:hypothetical protein
MMELRTTTPDATVDKMSHIKWINPAMTWLRALASKHYQEWLDLAKSLLPTSGKVLYGCGDVVHEAVTEALSCIHDGYEFESEDKLHMHIKRAVCLLSHVVDSEHYWTESP